MSHRLFLSFTLLAVVYIRQTSIGQTPQDYEKAYPEEYQDALNYLKENRPQIQNTLRGFQTDPNVLIAVVFPEIVRFSGVQNLVETASLELLYVRYGQGYADFSIGRFQMKPSFAEKAEEYLTQNSLESIYPQITYKSHDAKEIRKERIQRLKTLSWQLIYLAIFERIVQHKFAIPWNHLQHKITFLAAAYNHGFTHTQKEIESWIGKKAFPYGPAYKGTQYAYTEIAYDVYLRHLPNILR